MEKFSAENWERIYSKAAVDGISSHFLGIKRRGELDYSKGALKFKPQIENAILSGKSACIFGKVGIGKSFVAFDLLFDLKVHSAGEARVYYNRASVLASEFRACFKNISKTLKEVFAKESYYYDDPPIKCEIVVIDELDDLTSADDFQILLIDEYDVPLANASYHDIQNTKLYGDDKEFKADYHSRMVTLMKGFLGILKDKNALTKTIITGCLKVAKNSLFTGVNNFTVNSVADKEKKYTDIIGFTKEETYQFLKDYELDDYAQKVKEHYDGYKFFDKEMFCPWDVVKFVRKNFDFKQSGELSEIETGNYWNGSTSDNSLSDYIGYLTDSDNKKMQDLVDGKSISFKLNESMNYDTLSEHNSNDFWSLLLHTGYLTVDWEKTKKEELKKDGKTNKDVFARIPNLEILGCFNNNIKEKFSSDFKVLNLHNKFVNALSCGNQKEIYDVLFDMLQKYVSIRDTATKAPHENYYHGFINGIFTSCEKLVSEYHSNYESGNGYPDITFKAERNTKAVIIEIKATSNEVDMDELAAKALSQIEEMNYAQPFFKQSKITEIYAYGLVFCKKDCLVVCKKLK